MRGTEKICASRPTSLIIFALLVILTLTRISPAGPLVDYPPPEMRRFRAAARRGFYEPAPPADQRAPS